MGTYILSSSISRDKPYSHLKPGQESLDRDYYAAATHEKPDGQVAMSNYGRFESIYNQNVGKTVKIGDYVVPQKNANTMSIILSLKFSPLVNYEYAHNPDLFNHTKRGKIE